MENWKRDAIISLEVGAILYFLFLLFCVFTLIR